MIKRFMMLVVLCIVLFVLSNTVAHAQINDPSVDFLPFTSTQYIPQLQQEIVHLK